MTIIGRTEPRSPIEEQLYETIVRLDSTVWKRSDRERQERDADVLMRTVVGPALAQARRDAIEEVAVAIEARADREDNIALAALIREGANVARALSSEEA